MKMLEAGSSGDLRVRYTIVLRIGGHERLVRAEVGVPRHMISECESRLAAREEIGVYVMAHIVMYDVIVENMDELDWELRSLP